MNTCPAGHPSTEADYCSVCGLAIAAGGATATPPAAATRASPTGSGAATCPVCSEPRADAGARFCEVCRYDFQSGAGGQARAPAPRPSSSPRKWRVVVTVDPALDTEPDADAPCPTDAKPILVAIDRPELLVGRRDDRRDIRPDLALADPGASRRHAKLVLDGETFHLQDLASTNGTKLNASDVAPGSRHQLGEGDEITLGRWTRIRVEAG